MKTKTKKFLDEMLYRMFQRPIMSVFLIMLILLHLDAGFAELCGEPLSDFKFALLPFLAAFVAVATYMLLFRDCRDI